MNTRTLLFAVLTLVSVFQLGAKTYSNQTFLRARSALSNNLFCSSQQSNFARRQSDKLGTQINATYVFRHSHNGNEIAQYFGGGHEANGTQNGEIRFLRDIPNTDEARNDNFDSLNLDLTVDDNHAMYDGLATFKPFRSEYGVHLQVSQNLSSLHKNLWITIDAPVIRTEASMRPTITDTDDDMEGERYFFGGIQDLEDDEPQNRLCFVQISPVVQSKAHISDIKASLVFEADRTQTSAVTLSAHAVIPTSPKQSGKHLFDAQVGNNGHAAIGASTTYWHLLNHDGVREVSFSAHLKGQYILPAQQTRTLGVYNHIYKRLAEAGPYRRIVRGGGNRWNQLLSLSSTTPEAGANFLTRTMDVKPGGNLDAGITLHGAHGSWHTDLFYNIHIHSGERATLALGSEWTDNEYGFLQQPYHSGHSYSFENETQNIGNDASTIGGPIQAEGNTAATVATDGTALDALNTLQYYVTTQACQSPADLTHKLGINIGYKSQFERCTTQVSVGGEYESDGMSENSGIRSWATWIKLGLQF